MSDPKPTDPITPEVADNALTEALRRGAEYSTDDMTYKSHNLRDVMALRRELQAEETAKRGNLLQRGINPIPRRG